MSLWLHPHHPRVRYSKYIIPKKMQLRENDTGTNPGQEQEHKPGIWAPSVARVGSLGCRNRPGLQTPKAELATSLPSTSQVSLAGLIQAREEVQGLRVPTRIRWEGPHRLISQRTLQCSVAQTGSCVFAQN
jgi:hypothetical protein